MAMARAKSFSKSFYVSPPSSAPPRLKPVSVQPNGAAEDDGEQIRIKQLELSASTHEELFDSLESDEELSRSRVDWDQLVFKKFLGCGQFGDVCAMEFTPSDGGRPRPVAVKSLRPVRGSIGDLNDMRREIRLLSELSSKCANIVEFVGWGVVQGSGSDLGDGKGDRSLFLVEELCTEGSLSNKVVAQSVGTGSYSASDALAWTLDIARALDALHTQAQPIIHRDLKLGNVVLRASDVLGARPTAVLCDFGIAKPLPILPHEGSVRPRPGQLTRRNTMYQMTGNVGSCAYCAPEIVEGKQYGRRVDVYAFGVVVYELFAHTIASARLGLDNPYKEQLYMKKVKEHGIGLGVPDSWPESLRSLVLACWSSDAEERPYATEIVARLEEIQKAGEVQQMFKGSTGCCAIM